MILIREGAYLERKKNPTGIDKIYAGKSILHGNLLCPDMFLYGFGYIGPAFYRGIMRNDHDLAAVHNTDAGNNSGSGVLIIVYLPCGEWVQF